jgi:hypothetical protein
MGHATLGNGEGECFTAQVRFWIQAIELPACVKNRVHLIVLARADRLSHYVSTGAPFECKQWSALQLLTRHLFTLR